MLFSVLKLSNCSLPFIVIRWACQSRLCVSTVITHPMQGLGGAGDRRVLEQNCCAVHELQLLVDPLHHVNNIHFGHYPLFYRGRGLNFSECLMKNMLFENKRQNYEINSILFKTGQQLCSRS